jgi:hypothetical protein
MAAPRPGHRHKRGPQHVWRSRAPPWSVVIGVFEKKKQKLLFVLASAFLEKLGPGSKSFLVLFFKK